MPSSETGFLGAGMDRKLRTDGMAKSASLRIKRRVGGDGFSMRGGKRNGGYSKKARIRQGSVLLICIYALKYPPVVYTTRGCLDSTRVGDQGVEACAPRRAGQVQQNLFAQHENGVIPPARLQNVTSTGAGSG